MLKRLASRAANVDLVLAVLLLISVGLNLFYSYGPPALARASAEQQRLWSPGTAAPPLAVWNGVSEEVLHWKASSRPTLLYVFRADCGWCARNVTSLADAIRLASGKFDVVLLSIDGTDKPIASEYLSLGVPTYWISGATAAQGYRLTATPQTIVINPRGEVAYFWRGAYRGQIGRDVSGLLGGVISEAS